MNEIVRIYITEGGQEKCIQDPTQMSKVLLTATEPIDLDWHDERGHARMGTSTQFSGQTVKVGDLEIEIPIH